MTTFVRAIKHQNVSLKPKDDRISFKSGSNVYIVTLILSLAIAGAVIWSLF